MTNLTQFLSLLAQSGPAAPAEDNTFGLSAFMVIFVIVLVAGLTVSLGNLLARSLRMADYGWKIGLILLTVVLGLFVATPKPEALKRKLPGWPPKLGIDLSGGVILVYEVSDDEKNVPMTELVAALKRRINPSGVKEIVVRQYGDRQVEIIIPEVESAEIDYLKQMITTAGALKFRIVASRTIDDPRLFEIAERDIQEAANRNLAPPREVRDGDELLGEWVWLGIDEEKSTDANPVYKVSVSRQENMVRELQPGRREVLMLTTLYNVQGKDLASATPDYDEVGQPAVTFSMTGPGAAKFGGLTSTNLNRSLGIVLDEHLLSAPTINATITSRGIITGRFNQQEVDVLAGVLKAGKLPTALKKDPISDNEVSAILGSDTIQKGKYAIMVSLVGVIVFMLVYYRFAGIVACLALATSLLLIVSVMILVNAALTLPGLAGLVLIVGMSVDANVLIFERIREELARGSALRMAIRNGFGRATRTIVDANITTLITAVVLYAIATDQLKGFAVTLFLGILMSMYSAVFCSRVAFDIAERKRWISKLRMTQIVGQTSFDFVGRRKIAAACSIALIIVGLCGAVYRGKNLFDIDFNGGSSVQVMLNDPKPIGEVRALLQQKLGAYDPSVIEVQIQGRPRHTVYKIDTAITGEMDDATLKDRTQVVGADNSGLTLIENEIRGALGETTEKIEFISRDANTGQITVQVTLSEPLPIEKARRRLTVAVGSFDPMVTETEETDGDSISTFNVRLKASGTAVLQDQLMKIFDGQLVKRQVAFTPPQLVASAAGQPDGAFDTTGESDAIGVDLDADIEQQGSKPPADGDGERAEEESGDGEPVDSTPDSEDTSEILQQLPPSTMLAFAGNDWLMLAQAETNESVDTDAATTDEIEQDEATNQTDAKQDKIERSQESAEVDVLSSGTTDELDMQFEAGTGESIANTVVGLHSKISESELTFGEQVAERAVMSWINEAAAEVGLEGTQVHGVIPSNDGGEWTVQLVADTDRAERILAQLKTSLSDTPVWLSSNKIGAKVAGDMRNMAIAAMMVSLIGIVIYIWIRFQHVFFGLAAVVALVHDVLITLGALALSYWLADFLGFLLITEFKINLPIVAAFLTIIGYSLNDTIVVFDRIREVRGKSPDVTGVMINTSINQTLSRTFLTSITTLLVVVTLYLAGGEAIHGFAFALVVGVLVGTYSSIFVASPVLLWMTQPAEPVR